MYFGTDEQKARYLPRLSSGELIAAYALTEPQSGSDALAAKTTATLTADGRHYVLNGTKMWITNGGFADLFTIFAKVDGDKFTAFLVERSMGVANGRDEIKLGLDGSSTTALMLDNVKVPVENVLGQIGQGHKVAFNVLNFGRVKLGSRNMSGVKLALSHAVKYAKERRQFGKAISEFGLIKQKLAGMAVLGFVGDAMSYRTLGDVDRQIDAGDRADGARVMKTIESFSVECSINKVWTSEALAWAVDEGLQVFGGNGYSREFPLERMYRDARITRIYEGTNEINRMLVPTRLLKQSPEFFGAASARAAFSQPPAPSHHRTSIGGEPVPLPPSPQFRIRETQDPILTLGYHREWSPGQHTLFLASWLNDDYQYTHPRFQSPLMHSIQDVLDYIQGVPLETHVRTRTEIFSLEPQQIWEQDKNVAIVGVRYQKGDFRMQNLQVNTSAPNDYFSDPVAAQDLKVELERVSTYAYDQYEVLPSFWVTGGLAYDRVTFPDNLFAPPFSDQKTTKDQISPKAGLIWTAPSATTLRFAYTRSLSGASLEQSVRIEPTQVAGFNQAFRSLIPESIEGSIPGAPMETYAVLIEQKLGSRTYLGISAALENSDVTRTIGALAANEPPLGPPGSPIPPLQPATPASLAEELNYGEKSLRFTVDQLVGKLWSVGARYQITAADLRSTLPQIPQSVPIVDFDANQHLTSALHQVGLVGTFNHPSGAFAQLETDWYSQSNHGYSPAQPGDQFWQLNLFAGYRFAHRRAELAVGLLNLTDSDYHLSPLTFYYDLPRTRTLAMRFQFNF